MTDFFDSNMMDIEEPAANNDSVDNSGGLLNEISNGQQDLGNVNFDIPNDPFAEKDPFNSDNINAIDRVGDKQQKKEKLKGVKAESGAKAFSFVFENLMALVCSAVDETGDYKKYKLDKEDRETMQQAFEEYFEIREIQLSPEITLFTVLSLLATPRYIEAKKYKKERAKIEQIKKRAYKRQDEEKQVIVGTNEIVEAFTKEDYSHLREYKEQRQYFELEQGYYKYYSKKDSESRKYVKKTDRPRVGKPSPTVKAWLEQGLSNAKIKEILYG